MIEPQASRRLVAALRIAAAGLALELGAACWAAAALAAEGEGHGDPWRDLLWKTINFLALVLILYLAARKPLRALLGSAAREARAALQEQRDLARRAEQEASDQRARIEGLQQELQRMVAQTRDEVRAEHDRLLRDAQAQAERIRGGTQLQIEQEFSKARKALQLEVAEQTVHLAEALIRTRMDDAAQRRVASQAIDRLGAGP